MRWQLAAEPGAHEPVARPKAGVIRFDPRLPRRVERAVVRRHRISRSPLEHRQAPGLPRDLRNRLHAGGAGADHADTLTAEVDRLMGPVRGVVRRAGEMVETFEIRRIRCRQRPARHHQKAR